MHIYKKYSPYLITVLFSLVLLCAATPVFSQDLSVDELNKQIDEKKDFIKKIEKQIAERQAQINQERAKASSLQNQISILDNRVEQVKLDITATETKLEELNLEIDLIETEVDKLDKNIVKQKNIIAEFIRNINTDGHKSMLEIIATYDSFSDFYSQLQYLQTIEHDLGKSTKTLSLQKNELSLKQKVVNDRKQSYEELQKDLTQKKSDFTEQVYVKESLFVETKQSEKSYQTLLASLKKEYQSIENQISSIEKQVRQRLESENKLKEPADSSKTLSWPVESRYITARFRDPDYPYRNVFEHNAVDIRSSHGTPLRAAAGGYVATARRCSVWTCYSYVMIIHSGGISTVYGHMSNIAVSQDQFVARGDIIGYSGGTPRTPGAGPFVTGPHLHFEVRSNGIPVDPLKYLVKDW